MSIVRNNLLTVKNYTPYCGNCRCMSRTKFNGEQFHCGMCSWVSNFEPEFIEKYKAFAKTNVQGGE